MSDVPYCTFITAVRHTKVGCHRPHMQKKLTERKIGKDKGILPSSHLLLRSALLFGTQILTSLLPTNYTAGEHIEFCVK